MKMQRLFGTLAIVSFLAACSDGGVGPTEGDPLTEEESGAIAAELLEGAFTGFSAGLSSQGAPAPSAVPVSFSLDISHVEECQGGAAPAPSTALAARTIVAGDRLRSDADAGVAAVSRRQGVASMIARLESVDCSMRPSS